MLDVRPPPRVVGRIRAPMQGRRHDVVAALWVLPVIAAGLDNVNFAGPGPRAVGVFNGHHPDCRPEPLAFGELGADFDTAVFDGGALSGVDAGGLDGIDDGAVGDVGGGDAVDEDR